MADTNLKPILSVCATVGSKLSDLTIIDGQLVFVQDRHKIALDFNGKRVFYNQIDEIATDAERKALLAPITGRYYFVIDTAMLWTFNGGWIPITTPPEEIVFIGTELPELGSNKTLYVDITGGISVWDSSSESYVVVADKCGAISEVDIASLFS
ncbi:MAG: hypothetical protein II205_00300 [Bacteroidales bacterium]|nr:hypothetical protein [Bacteroidales bacterium]